MKRLILALGLFVASPAWADDLVKVGSVDICHDIVVKDADATDGSGKTGIAYNAAGLTCKYRRSDQASGSITTITLVDGTVGTHLDNSWKEIANGHYQLCGPDAAYSAGRFVSFWCYGASDMAPMDLRVILTDSAPSVNVSSITDGAIAAADFASGAITATVIAADAIGESELASGAITTAEIATGAIDADAIADDAIDAGAVAASTIGASEIAADAIGASEIAAAAIGAAEVATDAIDTDAIADDAILGESIVELAALPGTGSVTFKDMLRFLYQFFRNKLDQTNTTQRLFKADGSTALCTKSVADDGTTYTRGACT